MADQFVDLADEAQHKLDTATVLTTDQLQHLIGLAGRIYGPAFLAQAYSDGKVDNGTVRALVGNVWSACEYPDRELDRDTWQWLFDVAGYTEDGELAERPTEPVELWRGSVPERRTDWSWSSDRAVAEKFAAGIRGRRPGHLYRLVCPPEALLAANNDRSEAEFVVDTAMVEHLIEDASAD
ncbi:hypothetical protein ACFVXG_20325 [Kitasatospora sp. NPDC058162]|uniref:hypothetical protein n=1 Tax=Kitasatospora sp. NPDC058162 TaxID=3346362 RepID=UPI0036D7F988